MNVGETAWDKTAGLHLSRKDGLFTVETANTDKDYPTIGQWLLLLGVGI